MKNRLSQAWLLLVLLFGVLQVQAQNSQSLAIALDDVKKQSEKWGLSSADLENLLVSDSYLTKHNGVQHIYFQQSIDGVPIYNAITSTHVTPEGKVHYSHPRFYANARDMVNTTTEKISAAEAVSAAAQKMGIERAQVIAKESKTEGGNTAHIFEGSNISATDIKVSPMYTFVNGELKLSWDLAIDDLRNADYLSLRVDATNGEVIDQTNWTTYCQFDHVHTSCGNHQAAAKPKMQTTDEATEALVSGSYRVFALPAESPSHGPHVLVDNPHIPEASPFGWHDVDGDGNPDYTITRGNNVHAYPDLNDDDQSTGGEPDGGPGLLFDFPFDPDSDPVNSLEAATTNLFYMSNMMHDISYLFGFDEAAGNFQVNNFGNGGSGGDPCLSEAQDGSGTNNANFATPPDGGSGRMQMFLWTSGGEVLQILEPSNIAGGYETGEADFGPSIIGDSVDVQGEVVEAFDANPSNPTFCCGEIVNKETVDGKIALIDRGGCFFDQKVRNCEDAGAIAVIICNFDPSPIGMAPSGTVEEPDIPAVMIGAQDCASIRAWIGRGAIAQIKAPNRNLFNLDGDYDNGIIAHEFGHGISNRLTGGPAAAGCLGNAEQMGEGWSDFFSLITTVEPGDQGTDPRGIGTFAQRQDVLGAGIRPRQYTTDMSINEMTYRFTNLGTISQPHGIGSVWCTMLWDLYWAFVDEYGYDEDPSNIDAGNNIAIQLVMDGMKLQACQPGFVDGRDAILLADSINNEAANSCLIWSVFARRGLGYYASQGDSDNRFDQAEDFETAPLCQNKLRIEKSAENLIAAGDTINYTITVANNKADASTNVQVVDVVPDGCTLIPGSANFLPNVNGNELTFDLGDMESLQEITITYSVVSSPTGSATLWIDDFENGEDNWFVDIEEGVTIWYIQDVFAYNSENAFFTENGDGDADSYVYLIDPIQLDLNNPGARFFHWYSTSGANNTTETGNIDGGIIEVQANNGGWKFLAPEKLVRNGYTGNLPYGTFVLPNLSGFSGNSGDFVDTYIDLSDYQGQEVQIRFRFGTEAGGNDPGSTPLPNGWVVDDVEFLDLLFYNTEVCVSSDAGDVECAQLPGKGTLVEPNFRVSNDDLPESIDQALVYPNPAQDQLRIKLDANTGGEAQLTIISLDGRVIRQTPVQLRSGTQMIDIDVNGLSSGSYILDVKTTDGSFTKKWIKN